MHPKCTWSRNDVGSSRSTSFINFFHMGTISCFLPAILMSSTYTDKNNPCFRFPIRYFFQSKSQMELRTVFPTTGLQVDVRANFVREEPLGLQCLLMILDICAVEDGDCSCSQIWTFQDNLKAIFWQFSHRFQFFFFEVTVVKTWCRNFTQLLKCLIRQFGIYFHSCLRMTFHITRPRDRVRVGFFSTK